MLLDATDATPESIKTIQSLIQHFLQLPSGTLRGDIDLKQFGLISGQLITNGIVQEMCTLHSNVYSLNCNTCKLVSDASAWAIAKHCANLRELYLSGCDLVTNVGIRSLSLRCSQLVVLDLSHCSLLDDISMTVIAGII